MLRFTTYRIRSLAVLLCHDGIGENETKTRRWMMVNGDDSIMMVMLIRMRIIIMTMKMKMLISWWQIQFGRVLPSGRVRLIKDMDAATLPDEIPRIYFLFQIPPRAIVNKALLTFALGLSVVSCPTRLYLVGGGDPI